MKKPIVRFIFIFILSFFFLPCVYAGTKTNMYLFAENCYSLDDDYVCLGPNGDSPEELDEIQNGGNVEPSKIIRVGLYYNPYSPFVDVNSDEFKNREVTLTYDKYQNKVGNAILGYAMAAQIGITYDSSIVEPVYDGNDAFIDDLGMPTVYQDGIWPAQGTSRTKKNNTDWTIAWHDSKDNQEIKFLVSYTSPNKTYLSTSGIMFYMYFKVKDTAPAGSNLDIKFDRDFTALVDTMNTDYYQEGRFTKTQVLWDAKDLNLKVYGEMSNDKSLGKLAVKGNNKEYELSPVFKKGDISVNKYNVIVPNHISSIDITAIPNDTENATVVGAVNDIITKNLDVGENLIDIVVQAQNGETQTYQLNAYRLNNDSSLKSLELSNADIGTFKNNIYTYNATVPYKIASSTISASTNDKNASIISGLDEFNFTSYGENVNTREIKVNAENCDDKYKDILDNTCSSSTYTINISRISPSTNNNLSDLKVDGVSVNGFSPNITTYNLDNVSNDKASITLDASLEDDKASFKTSLGTKDLKIGDNKIDIVVQAENGENKTYTINIRRLNNDSTLKSLYITSNPSGKLSPNFSSNFFNYYTYLVPSDVKEVNIDGVPNDNINAKIISGNGKFDVTTTDEVDLTVQAEDGSTSIYIIKLERQKSNNNYLKILQVDGYKLNEEFDKEKTLYSLSVAGDVESVNISAAPEDANARIISGIGKHNLEVGTNTIQVRVQAEDGTTKDYTISISRNKKTIAKLTDLKVDGNTVDGFSEDIYTYNLGNYPFSKTRVNIEATPKDSDSTVTGTGDISIKTGDNKLYIVVTSEDGNVQSAYILNLTRDKDSDATLKDLKIDNKTIDEFDSNKESYGITVENNITSLNLEAIPNSKTATVTISNNEGFQTNEDNVVSITVTAENGDIKIYKIHVTRAKSSNNYLSNILLDKGVLNPVFNKTTNSYTVDLTRDNTSINITPVLDDATSSYKLNGPTTLDIGENIYTIVVTSETSTTNTYTIKVNRNPSNNNYLKNIEVDGEKLENFSKENNTYTINANSNKNKINISSTSEEEHATVTGNGEFDLVTGVNTFVIKVVAENGEARTYSIIVNKMKSTDNYLKSLSIDEGLLNEEFDKDKLSYTANVPYNITNININAVPNDISSTVEGDGVKSLKTGDNKFDIVVKAEDNTTRTYSLNVNREKNNNAYLTNIVASNGFTYEPEFSKNTLSYDMKVSNDISKINISAFTEDKNATVVGGGEISLNTGNNKIELVVTAEDGITTKTYILNIDRAKSNNNYLKSLTIKGGELNKELSDDINEYSTEVPYEIDKMEAVAIPKDNNATVKIDSNKDLEVGDNTKTITVVAENGDVRIYSINIKRDPSVNNFLKKLSVLDANNNEYITDFTKTKNIYDITVENDIDLVNISYELDDNSATAKLEGNNNLNVGNNIYTIKVKSASNVTRTYTININRKSNSNAYLKDLKVDNYNLTPLFSKTNISYMLNVNSDVSKINISAVPEVDTSLVSGTGEFDINTGSNKFEIKVTAEDKVTIMTYVIIVNKEASSNNYLSSLSVTPFSITPEFNKENLEYNLDLDNLTNKITINATSEDKNATVSGIGEKDVKVGSQVFEIKVVAENNLERIYKINVTRAKSSNNNLKSLLINQKEIDDFDKNKTDYLINVDNSTDKIIIDAISEDETATISNLGEKNLATGDNIIEVPVQAENGEIKIYKLTINRAKSSNNYLKSLVIDDGDFTPEFNKETLTYSIDVPNEIDKLNLVAIPEDDKATVEIDGNEEFIVGKNQVIINIIAENNSVRTYTINVNKQPKANNYLNDIVVTDEDGIKYDLDPVFDKKESNYNIVIPSQINYVYINVTKSSPSLEVEGDGRVEITSSPMLHKITVSTTGGTTRIYNLTFTKSLSSNNKLDSLTVDKGTLDPVFDKDETAYNIDLPKGTDNITINATASDGAKIAGTGLKELKQGRNTFKIIVTAENGNTKIYTLFVNVNDNTDKNILTSLTVDKGTLSPEFNPNNKLYKVEVDENISNITIDATGNYLINGTGEKNLDIGSNIFEVTTTDDNNNTNIYRVVVYRGNTISKYLKYLAVDNYQLNEKFDKEKFDYSIDIPIDIDKLDVIAVPEDKNGVVTITGNNNLNNETNTININVRSVNNEETNYTILVNKNNYKITSSIHIVEDKYIRTIKEGEKVLDVKNEMDNDNGLLRIYDNLGNELNDNDKVGTSYVIKLIINNKEYDSKVLIIKGDLNSDGEIGVADVLKLRLNILGNGDLDEYQQLAADTNDDGEIGVADLIKIRSHILGNLNIFGG